MTGTPSPTLRLERCRVIARTVLGAAATEEQVTEMAADIARFVAGFPPRTQEQLNKIMVLLRPGPGQTGRPDGP